MAPDLEALRAEARKARHFCLSPAVPGLEERTVAFERLRNGVLAQADQILLYAWRAGWGEAMPASVRPDWADRIDAAPGTVEAGHGAKVLDKALVIRYVDELAVIKPRVRWKPVTGSVAGLPASASPGEVLLCFTDAHALAAAVIAAGDQRGLSGFVVSRGMSSFFSASTWKALRLLAEQTSAGRVLVGVNPGSRCLQCYGNAATADHLVQALASLLGSG